MKYLLAAITSCLLGCFILLPLICHPATIISDDSDGLLGAWTLTKVQNNLLESRNIFDGQTFYPHHETILFSDIFVTSAVLTLPLRVFTREPLIFYNVAVVASLILTIFAAFLLFDEVLIWQHSKQWPVAFIGAVVFSLSTIHMRYVPHLHVFALQYVILALWSILRFLRTKSQKLLIFAALMAAAQMWQSFFLVYYIIFFACAFCCVPTYRKTFLKSWQTVGVACLAFITCSAPVLLAYVHFLETYHTVRDIREAIHFSLIFPDFWGQFWSPMVYVVLALGGMAYVTQKKVRSSLVHVLFGLALFSFIMCLGPALHWGSETVKPILFGHTLHVPLPYTLFYYLAPGFGAFRTPSRFLPLASLVGMAASIVVLARLPKIQMYSMPIGVLLMGITFILVYPQHFVMLPRIREYPAVVTFIAARPEHILLKLPIRSWDGIVAKEDTYQMLYNLEERKQLVNGQSGFYPNEWLLFQHQMDISFPSTEAIQAMKTRGVELLLIDRRMYPLLDQQLANLPMTIVYRDPIWMVAHVQ